MFLSQEILFGGKLYIYNYRKLSWPYYKATFRVLGIFVVKNPLSDITIEILTEAETASDEL